MSLLGEIKRRKVFQVAAAYAIVGWLLIEVASVLLPTFQAPEWVMRAFSFVVIAGFPLAVILAWAFDLTPQGVKVASAAQVSEGSSQLSGQRLGYLIQGLILLAVGFLVADQYLLRPDTAAVDTAGSPSQESSSALVRVDRTLIPIGVTEPIGNTGLSAHIAISPDGRHIVYAAESNGESQLFLRALDQLEARAIPGTEGAYHPVFSPDGDWVTFVSDGTDHKLKKVSIRGGPPQSLADSSQAGGTSWGIDDSILFATADVEDANGVRRIFRVPSAGGEPEVLLSAETDMWPTWPEPLPGGRAVLFTMRLDGGAALDGSVGLLSLETGEYKVLISGAYNARYAPSGHVVFMRAGTLSAVPFDLESLELAGSPVPILEGVESDGVRGGSEFSFANDGTLIYIGGRQTGGLLRTLAWVDRDGNEESLPLDPGGYSNPKLSPDGQQLAFIDLAAAGGTGDVWVHHLVRRTTSPLTFDGMASSPVWSRDSQDIVFASNGGIFQRRADGNGQTQTLFETGGNAWPLSFSPDGSGLVFTQSDQIGADLHLLMIDSEQVPEPLFRSEFNVVAAAVSPDGRWVAYQSDESGLREIYVRPFPRVSDGGPWKVSFGGGVEPVWGPDSRELFYHQVDGPLMVVEVQAGTSFSAGRPTNLFDTISVFSALEPLYDVSRDGQRFLIVKAADQSEQVGPTELVVVHNWFEELNRLAPPSE